MSLARVASIHFAEVTADRAIYGGRYAIPAVGLGQKPVILEIEDKVQRDEGPISTGPGGNRRQQLRYHVDGFDIARDIVNQWTANGLGYTPDAHPGIWLVRDRLPLMRKDEHGKEDYVMDGFGHQVFRPAST